MSGNVLRYAAGEIGSTSGFRIHFRIGYATSPGSCFCGLNLFVLSSVKCNCVWINFTWNCWGLRRFCTYIYT